jgi:hypothetical protein
MTLNSSGPISLAGTTAGVSIEIENGGSGTAQISLNDTAVRTLAGVPSGAITMPTNFYGKSNRVTISYTFTSSTANASLNISSISGYSSGKSNITVTVNSGVYLYATSTGNYGLNLTGGTTGDTLSLVNNGYIMGQGGVGSGGNGAAGAGGPALNIGTGIGVTINNGGYIGGGGGGGGYSSCGVRTTGGGGGAGGGAGGSTVILSCCISLSGGGGGGIGGSGGNGATFPRCCNTTLTGGGGGGRIMPGSGGSGSAGGAGGGAGGQGSTGYYYLNYGGNGGSGGGAGGNGNSGCYDAGGGGGYGASGGTGGYQIRQNPGTGGKAINKNGNTVTFSAGCSRVYGAIS